MQSQRLSSQFFASISLGSPVSKTEKIKYFIVESKCKTQGVEGATVYGIVAEAEIDGKIVDKCAIEDVSSNKDEVLRLIEKLARNTVTPVTLADVVEDFITGGVLRR
jgi:hypothetical protein